MDDKTHKQRSKLASSLPRAPSQPKGGLVEQSPELINSSKELGAPGSQTQVSLPNGMALSEHPIRVLIVDDVEDTRERLHDLLRDASDIIVVGKASDGDEAIEQFDLLIPDVMTTCINMPRLDGISATEEICKRHPNAGVIICSVQSDMNYRRRASIAGAKEYLVKPPSAKEFIEAIRRVAGR